MNDTSERLGTTRPLSRRTLSLNVHLNAASTLPQSSSLPNGRSASAANSPGTTVTSLPLTHGFDGLKQSLIVTKTTPFLFCPRDGRPFQEGEQACPLCQTPRNPSLYGIHMHQREARAPAKWRKLLYVKQDFPDNHVDSSFLEELQRNVNVRTYDYWELVVESGSITQQGSSIVLFAIIFLYTLQGTLSASFLIWFSFLTTLAAYGYWDFKIRQTEPNMAYPRLQASKGAVLFLASLLGLSPILKTLTEDTSSDTVWALTSILFLGNLLLHDYRSNGTSNISKFPGSLSLNAAIFGSVMLASRLPSNLHVFGLMALAIEWFAFFPMFRRYLKWISREYHVRLTVITCLVTTLLLFTLSTTIAILYIAAILFVTFVCPYWLLWMQRYKNEIHGPWDEAPLTINGQNMSD